MSTDIVFLLLTRSRQYVILWEIPENQHGKTSPKPKLKHCFAFLNSRDRFKYIKWLTAKEFIALSDDDDLYRVNYEARSHSVFRLSLPWQENFHIFQVYPLSMDKEPKGFICLANKEITIRKDLDPSQSTIDSDGPSPGVDYILVFEKVMQQKPDASDRREGWLRNLPFNSFVSRVRPPRVDNYKVKHRRLLPRNVRNMKFCMENRFMLVNYDENELGTVAPELWHLDFEHDKDLAANVEDGTIAPLPVPDGISSNSALRWGEASFAGPYHDIIVCDVDGEIRFYQFSRSGDKSPQTMKSVSGISNAINEKGFAEFYHPIFTWGDTAPKPIMAATDRDGTGKIYVWSVPDDSQPPRSNPDGVNETSRSQVEPQGNSTASVIDTTNSGS